MPEFLSAYNFYLIAAVVGGAFLIAQALMMMFGYGGDADHASEFALDEAGVDGNPFFGHLSVKTVAAFLTFFGLTGLLTHSLGWTTPWSAVTAFAAGCLAFYIVAMVMISFAKLHSEGNIRLHNAVGQVATVYLKVPARNAGSGKVTVQVQERLIEANAVTAGDEIPTGAKATVVGVLDSETLEVALYR